MSPVYPTHSPVVLRCDIPGQPVGHGRPRASSRGGFVRLYTPEKTRDWVSAAVDAMKRIYGRAPAIDGRPLMLQVRAVAQRPKRMMGRKYPAHRIYRMAKPDGDNVLKSVADALVKAGVIRDDVLIVEWRCACGYTAIGEEPRVEVDLTEVDG